MRSILVFAAIIAVSAVPLLASASQPASSPEPSTQAVVAVFDCAKLTWMNDCDEVNRRVKADPNAHLSVRDSSGLEFNFPPGTPAVMMRHLILRTPETAKEVVDFFERHMAVAAESAELWKNEMARRGEFTGVAGRADAKNQKTAVILPANTLKLFVFYDSRHKDTRRQLTELRRFASRQPNIPISIIQINDDKDELALINKNYGIKGIILTGPRREALLQQISISPTTWIQLANSSQTQAHPGFIAADDLESVLRQYSLSTPTL
jgi:hypothetical protein